MGSLRNAPFPEVPFLLRRRQCETNSVRGSDHGVAAITFVAPGWGLDRMGAKIAPEGAKSKDVRNEGNSCQLVERKRPKNRHNIAIKECCPAGDPQFSAHRGPAPASVANDSSLGAQTSLWERRAGSRYPTAEAGAIEAVALPRGPDETPHAHKKQNVRPSPRPSVTFWPGEGKASARRAPRLCFSSPARRGRLE